MLLFVILLAATIMAVFGMIGLLRVARASIIFLAVMLGGLAFLRFFGPRLVALVNLGVRFIQGGGFTAVTGSDPGKALAEVFSNTSGAKPFIDTNDTAGFYLLIFFVFVLIGLGLSSLRALRLQGHFSIGGLLLGLITGYIIAAYLTAVLFPGCALLPVPMQIKGMTLQVPLSGLLTAGGADVWSQFLQSLTDLANSPWVHWIVAGLIVIFIFMASRLSAKRG